MQHLFINKIREEDRINDVYLVLDKQLRPNKNGIFYLQFNLSDKTGLISARLWNATQQQIDSFENGDYIKIEGATQRFQGALQLIVKSIEKVDPETVDQKNYLRQDRVNRGKLEARLRELLLSISDPELWNLANCFLNDEQFMTLFCKTPAGVKLHHAYLGGLLEHTTQMMETARKIAELYPRLNSDILLFGTFLHDIGKIRELACENELLYTDEGQLLGHPLLGMEILLGKIKELEALEGKSFNPETAMILKHLMISHHGTYKNQSPKLPMTLEAMVIHFIDTLDSKMAEFEKYMSEDPNLGHAWTNYIPGIERKLYKKSIAEKND